jgi:hypothetical protein
MTRKKWPECPCESAIKNVLRTIGTVHAIEIRDYHIEVLKYKLKDLL